MLWSLRYTNRRCVYSCFTCVCSRKLSTKVSNAVKPVYDESNATKISNAIESDYEDYDKHEHYRKTPSKLFSSQTNKQPLCTSVPKNVFMEDWTRVSTNWKNIPFLYMKLSKIRLTTLVVITTMAGYAAATAPFEVGTFFCCCLGTGLVSSAANAVNQYHEVPFDAQMSRTKNRVLVKAQLTPLHALGFASLASLSGLSILFFGCNGLTASLGAVNLVLYTCIYTPLKRISILNTWVGSVVGAIPPMMGWASCTGNLESGAWLLAGILYTWQFPHFNALSWNMRADYSRAGYRMMAVTHPDLCRRTTLRYTVAITALCMLAPICDMTNNTFLIQMLPLNLYFTYLAYKFYHSSDSASSRQLFKFSLLHLPLLIILILINKKHWFLQSNSVSPNKDTKNVIPNAGDKSSLSNLESNNVKVAKL